MSFPGKHYALPFVTRVETIKTRPVTNQLDPVRTITRDGIQNAFTGVQVISDVQTANLIPMIRKYGLEFRKELIFDRIAEELITFCANHTIDEVYNTMFLDLVGIVKQRVEERVIHLIGNDSIHILNLVIPKPNIPNDILENYKKVKVQWTEQLVAQQQQKKERILEETEKIKAILDAEREKEVLEIDIQKNILKKEGDKNLSSLENAIIKEREENKANVENYKKTKDAEANKRLYTKDFVRLEMAKALSQNTKFYFSGDTSPLGALLSKIMGENK